MRFLERLNRPAAFVLAMVFLLATGGFLLFENVNSTSVNPSGGSLGETGESSSMAPDTVSEKVFGTTENTVGDKTVASAETTVEVYADDLGPFSAQRPGMEDRVNECEEEKDQEACIEDLVAFAAPEAFYIGTRTELNVGGRDRNNQVLYFEDPNLKSCEFMRKEFDSGEGITYYSVVIAGEGSFSNQRDEECVIDF